MKEYLESKPPYKRQQNSFWFWSNKTGCPLQKWSQLVKLIPSIQHKSLRS